MAYNNNRNNNRYRNTGVYGYPNVHQHDPESNSTYDYYYEDEFGNYYEDFDVNHPEEFRERDYMHDEDYDFNDYGTSLVHIDSTREHPYRRRSTEYNQENVPHTSAMGGRYSPRYQRKYNREEHPRSGYDSHRDDMYAEGAGYADWDTIEMYGIAGDHPHNVIQHNERYSGPYNYGYENTVYPRTRSLESPSYRSKLLPVKRNSLYPESYRKMHERDNYPVQYNESRNTKGRGSKRRSSNKESSITRDTKTRRGSGLNTTRSNQGSSTGRSRNNQTSAMQNQNENTNRRNRTVSNSRLTQENSNPKRRGTIVNVDRDEEFLSDHAMYTVRRRPQDRQYVVENNKGSGFSRYGSYSEGRYTMDDYEDIFDEDTTGRRQSQRGFGKAGQRSNRERA